VRRYSPLKPSKGTTWSPEVRLAILRRDNFTCVGRLVGFPLRANHMGLELDHVRASHGIGMKSRSTADNGVALCGECHRWKTEHGREARPLLLAYLSTFGGSSR
jgi:5-methylcytosine-specific restriction endonuclease McrA